MAQMRTLKTGEHPFIPAVQQEPNPEAQPQGNRLPRLVLSGLLIVGLLIAGAFAYIWFSGGSGTPSRPADAPALALAPDDTRTRFQILSQESEARFSIDEELIGQPTTVVGTTDQVAGELLVDLASPENTQVGTIRVNVRTLETDNEIRNRALRGQILQADDDANEFAEFVPTTLIGLPEQITWGRPFEFQIMGTLTLHGVTRETTFTASVTPLSETRLEGVAQTTVIYRDFNISIPQAPGVANVSNDVSLAIEFVAVASSAGT